MDENQASSHPLIDILPPGALYDDREGEEEAVEDLRRGYLTMIVSVPMAQFKTILAASLKPGEKMTYARWAHLRYHLQDVLATIALSMSLPTLRADEVALVDLGAAGDVPDVAQVYDGGDRDAILGEALDILDGIGDVVQPMDGDGPGEEEKS